MEFALDNFNFTVSVFSGKLDTSFDFSSSMVVPRFDINIDPVKISDLLRLIPEEIAREYAIPRDIDTDATLAVESHLTRPYDMGDDALPYATFRFRIPESSLRWRQLDLRKLELDAGLDFDGRDFDAMTAEISRLLISARPPLWK